MRGIHWSLLISVATIASGCATKEKATTYWTEKNGIASVHHVVGKVDNIEKLSEKPLTVDQVDNYNLPKGKKYFTVVESHANIPKATPTPAPKKDDKKESTGSKLADVTSQLHDLKRQISEVAAENKRLQEQLAAGQQQAQPEVPQQTANAAEAPPRMSQ
jgi:phage tail sheath protein FI